MKIREKPPASAPKYGWTSQDVRTEAQMYTGLFKSPFLVMCKEPLAVVERQEKLNGD